MLHLPVDDYVEQILRAVQHKRAAVVVAPPGSGKTTRIPPALARHGRTIVLQPRRVAARSLARRIAEEQGWQLGREVGWHIRHERQFTRDTRLLVATEGILTARLQNDPLLSEFSTIVIDEFHERSLHGDLALALAKQAWRARNDLRVVVMSATLDAEPVSRFLDGCPVIEIEGQLYPVEIDYRPDESVVSAVESSISSTAGDLLVFLPGVPEIESAHRALKSSAVEILPLHGRLSSDEQDAVLRPSSKRKVILSTNLAETSLTVEGVTLVIDSGLQKTARYDAGRGIDLLVTERISADSADQRAGRAGRVAPGRAIRLWDRRDILRLHRQPEIERVDLTGALLEILAWGDDPARFHWFERPPAHQLESARVLLELLGATEHDRLTTLGQSFRRLPLHPRLSAILLAAKGHRRAAELCALLAEARPVGTGQARGVASDSDLLLLIENFAAAPPTVKRLASEIEGIVGGEGRLDDVELRRAILAGYPDRVAQRRSTDSTRFLLASGHGAVLSKESSVRTAEWIVASEVRRSSTSTDTMITLASAVDKDWITPTRREVLHHIDRSGRVRAIERELCGELLLREREVEPDGGEAEGLIRAATIERFRADPAMQELERRARIAGIEFDVETLAREQSRGSLRLHAAEIPAAIRRSIDRSAPEQLKVPSGRSITLDYRPDGSIVAAVKLQELFGLADTPRIGKERIPVTFELLSPAGRPVQTTRDLKSFWETMYPEVRKELRARYPKHPWPEDPWTATPTARTNKRTK